MRVKVKSTCVKLCEAGIILKLYVHVYMYMCDGITLKGIFLKVHRIKIVPSYTV